MLIAIDPGIKTGIAVFKEGKLIHNTYVHAKGMKPFHEFIDNIRAEVFIHRDKHQPFDMVIEKSHYKYINICFGHYKTLGVFEYFYDCEYIAPASVKKIITGNGRASKEEVKKAVLSQLSDYERQFVIQESEDAVDAVAIGLAHLKQLKGVS